MKLKDFLNVSENKATKQISFSVRKKELKKYRISLDELKEVKVCVGDIKNKKVFKCEKCKKFYISYINQKLPFVCDDCEKEIFKKAFEKIQNEERKKMKKLQGERKKEYMKEYNKRLGIIEKRKEYHHKPEIIERRKKYEKENKEKIKKRHKKYMKEYMNKYIKDRRKSDLNYAIGLRLRASLHKALKTYSTIGKIMTSKKYGIDYKEIIEHLKPFPKDIEKYHIDHIKPLSSFDLNNQEEVKKAFDKNNLQWLTAEENREKSDNHY